MAQFQRPGLNRNKITAGLLLAGLLLAWLSPSMLLAQTCVGDPCVYHMTLTLPTSTPTPAAGTPTAMPTAELPWTHYSAPTSIPTAGIAGSTPEAISIDPITFTNVVSWGAYSPADISLSTTPLDSPTAIPMTGISGTLSITHSDMLTISGQAITHTEGYTVALSILDAGQGVIGSVLSYTGYLSITAASLEPTETITIPVAPDWYAPQLPRDMAGVGWMLENIDSTVAHHYSVTNLAELFGLIVAMPFRLARMLWEFFKFLGPIGLFLIWLIVFMLPTVLGFKILIFIKNSIIRTFNFVLAILDWLWKLWEAIPFMN